MHELIFVRFGQEHFDLYKTWCMDEQSKRWLGLPDDRWLAYVLTNEDSFTWMIFDQDVPVGQTQIDLYDDDPTRASIAVLVAPDMRRQGYGTRILCGVVAHLALANVQQFHAFIELANTPSLALAAAAGFKRVSPEPDKDGFLEYIFSRNP